MTSNRRQSGADLFAECHIVLINMGEFDELILRDLLKPLARYKIVIPPSSFVRGGRSVVDDKMAADGVSSGVRADLPTPEVLK
jgi:hypothetical protein